MVASTSSRDERLPHARRVTHRASYDRAQRLGARVHTPHFVLVVTPREVEIQATSRPAPGSAERRLGIVVTKRVSRLATRRNRVKRLVREVFRKTRERFPEGCDVVFIAKAGAEELGFAEVLGEVARAEGALRAAARRARAGATPPEQP